MKRKSKLRSTLHFGKVLIGGYHVWRRQQDTKSFDLTGHYFFLPRFGGQCWPIKTNLRK